jgi:predicted ribosome quality control (RQC) complex YloA/Tae2 family protein
MNDGEIDPIVAELRAAIGAPLSNVWQPARDRVVLGLGDGSLWLLVPRGPLSRIHAIRQRPSNPPKPFSFQGACRAHLQGALRDVERIAGDRIVRITFARGALELRLTGKSGGLWLLDGERVVASHDGPAPSELPAVAARGSHTDVAARFAPDPGQSWSDAADAWFGGIERDRALRELRARVEAGLDRTIARNDRLVENLHEDLRRADEAPAVRHRADLLAANLHRVRRGDASIAVEDWDTGQTVMVDLDPAKPPPQSLERLYDQARRLDRTADRVLERLGNVERELAWMRSVRPTVQDLDHEQLAAIALRLPTQPTGRARDPDAPAAPFVTWLGPRGQRVLVGKSARGNRILTFQSSKGYDWWMHLRGRPGAHLVLPTPKDRSPPLELLLAAAQIALLAGRIGVGEAAEVQYTRVRDVRAVRGEEGLVTVRDERVLRVVRDPDALAGWAPLGAD